MNVGMSHKNVEQGLRLDDKQLKEVLTEGRLDIFYNALPRKVEEKASIKATQARKILEMVREIKYSDDINEMRALLAKTLSFLDYQLKRKVISLEIKMNYEKIIKCVLEEISKVNDINKARKLVFNLYEVIEMLTIAYYEKEGR